MAEVAPEMLVYPAASPRHVPALDGVRGVAILAVMVFHMSVLADVVRPDRPWMDRAWLWVATFGGIGVDLFFVLSGFLITGILLAARGRAGYFLNFFARRVLRIFPLYYLVVVLALVVIPHIHNLKSAKFAAIAGDEWGYWSFLANWVIGYRHAFRHGILDVTWSLGIEEQFYLLWPAVVLALTDRRLLWACGGLFVGAAMTRAALFIGLHASEITVMTWTPCRVDALAAGAVVAVLARSAAGLRPWRRAAVWAGAVSAAVVLGHRYFFGGWGGDPVAQTLGYSALAIGFAGLVLLAASAPTASALARALSVYPLRQLGRFSYALYLFHFPIRALVRDTVYGPSRFLRIGSSQLPGQFLFYGICMTVSVALAWASWHGFEKHFLKLKRFVPMPGPSPELRG